MLEYAIGDIQGCYHSLMRLLEHIQFDATRDRLWFAGDLVNRGPDSLAVLRFIKSLPIEPIITLGNHDLHLLRQIFADGDAHEGDTLHAILTADDKEELGHWLRSRHILYYDAKFNTVMTHAGIAPVWDLTTARRLAAELETVLHGADFTIFLANMFGNNPSHWDENLTGIDRWRLIGNYFTRMRFCHANGDLELACKGTMESAPDHLYSWFNVPKRVPITAEIIFGHWSALTGITHNPKIHAIDTGCVWGEALTALRLNDRKRFAVSCQ